jgi:cellulose biosynthesis protein BcsQ
LNQFDASLPLHLDVRAILQQQLGSRLLPLVLHRSSAVSEALAEGMTVIDYAPGIEVAEDYRQLAAWLRSVSVPAPVSHGSLRWTER